MDKRTFFETWFRRVWEEEDLSAIDEMMAQEADMHGMGDDPVIGQDAFKEYVRAQLALIDISSARIAHFMEDGDWGHALIDITATCRRTGNPVSISGQAMGRIVDGRVSQGRNHFDFLSLFEQLGQLPEDTFGTCLGGHRIA